jgi:ABC-type microcin C transport system permease subunit YejB
MLVAFLVVQFAPRVDQSRNRKLSGADTGAASRAGGAQVISARGRTGQALRSPRPQSIGHAGARSQIHEQLKTVRLRLPPHERFFLMLGITSL